MIPRIRRSIRWAALIGAMNVSVASQAHASPHNAAFRIFTNFTHAGDGSPFSEPLCTGVTSDISFSNMPGHAAALWTSICPQLAGVDRFGAQFFSIVHMPAAGNLAFTLVASDAATFYQDGIARLTIFGDRDDEPAIRTNNNFISAGDHLIQVNYYSWNSPSTLQLNFSQRTLSDAPDNPPFDGGNPSVTPEPASMALLATGLLGMGAVVRRRRSRA